MVRVFWTERAQAQLEAIYNYYKHEKQSLSGAKTVKKEILAATKGIVFVEQYQRDEIQPEYRRIFVRQYKIIYKPNGNEVIILRIFNTYQNPDRLM